MAIRDVPASPSELESVNPKRYTTVLPFTSHGTQANQSLPPIVPTKNPLRYATSNTYLEVSNSTSEGKKSIVQSTASNMKSSDVPSLPPLSKDISTLTVTDSWFPSSTYSDFSNLQLSLSDTIDSDRSSVTTIVPASSSTSAYTHSTKSSNSTTNELPKAQTVPIQPDTLTKPRIPSKSPARTKSQRSLRHNNLPPVNETPDLPSPSISDNIRQRSNSERSHLYDMDSRPYAPLTSKASRESSVSKSSGSRRYYPPSSFVFPKTPQRPSSSNSSSVASTTDQPFSPITPPRSSSLERTGRSGTKSRVRDGTRSLEASPMKPHRRRRRRRYGTPVNIEFESVDGISLDFTASDQVKLVSEMSIVEDEAEEIRNILFSNTSSFRSACQEYNDEEEEEEEEDWGGAPPPPSFGPKTGRAPRSLSPPPPYRAERTEARVVDTHDVKKHEPSQVMTSLSSWQAEMFAPAAGVKDNDYLKQHSGKDYLSQTMRSTHGFNSQPTSPNMDESKLVLRDLLRGLLSRTYEPALSDVIDRKENEVVFGQQKAVPMIASRHSVMTKMIKN